MKTLIVIFAAAAFYACESGTAATSQDGAAQPAATPTPAARSQKAPEFLGPPKQEGEPERQAQQPKTIRDFFALLPDKYFTLEGCDRATDKDCTKARAQYLKSFTEVEDTPNGYFKGGCDGGQSCIELAIFKRPDGTYLVGLATSHEMANEFRFLDYAGGQWADVSADVVPDYGPKNWYEIPRRGTTMRVFEKKITERGDDYETSEKGKPLYSLAWKEGRFQRQ